MNRCDCVAPQRRKRLTDIVPSPIDAKCVARHLLSRPQSLANPLKHSTGFIFHRLSGNFYPCVIFNGVYTYFHFKRITLFYLGFSVSHPQLVIICLIYKTLPLLLKNTKAHLHFKSSINKTQIILYVLFYNRSDIRSNFNGLSVLWTD